MLDLLKKNAKHVSSSGIKEIKLDKRGDEGAAQGLQYIEEYATTNGYKVVSVGMTNVGFTTFLTKD